MRQMRWNGKMLELKPTLNDHWFPYTQFPNVAVTDGEPTSRAFRTMQKLAKLGWTFPLTP